ncbi:MAG: YceI family protein [Acidimicrobiales bacterium]
MDTPTPGEWKVDAAASRLGFTARLLGVIKVTGSFGEFGGSAHIAADVTRSSASGTIASSSVTTGHDARDRHLRSRQFLSARRHPSISFRTSSVGSTASAGRWAVGGELTVRGVTQPIVVNVTVDAADTSRVRLAGEASIDRSLFGVGRAMPIVGRTVKIDLDVTLIPA